MLHHAPGNLLDTRVPIVSPILGVGPIKLLVRPTMHCHAIAWTTTTPIIISLILDLVRSQSVACISCTSPRKSD